MQIVRKGDKRMLKLLNSVILDRMNPALDFLTDFNLHPECKDHLFPNERQRTVDFKELSLSTLSGIFAGLAGLLVVALVAFTIELLVARRCMRRRRQPSPPPPTFAVDLTLRGIAPSTEVYETVLIDFERLRTMLAACDDVSNFAMY